MPPRVPSPPHRAPTPRLAGLLVALAGLTACAEEPPAAPPLEGPVGVAEEAARGAGASLAGDGVEARPDAPERVAAEGPEGKDAAPCAFHPTRRIHGRVQFPEGTPADEVVEVCAQVLPRKEVDPDDVTNGLEWLATREWVQLDAVRVAPSGAFELPLPVDVDGIAVLARGTYLIAWVQLEEGAEEEPVLLEPTLGGSVTLVLDTSGVRRDPSSLVGRTISIHSFGGGGAQAELDEDLEATFRHLEPESGRRVAFGPPPMRGMTIDDSAPFLFRVAKGASVSVVAGSRDRQVILVEDTLEISGRVLDADGAPVPGAWVTGNGPNTHTDDDGHFRMPGQPLGSREVRVHASGFLDARHPVSPGPEDLTLEGVVVTLDRGLSLSGRVQLADGRPVPGISIELRRPTGWTKRLTADEEGRFEIGTLAPGSYDLLARARLDVDAEVLQPETPSSAGPAPLLLGRLEAVAAGTRDLILTLGATPRVIAEVRDPQGRPVDRIHLYGVREGDPNAARFPGVRRSTHEASFRDAGGRAVWEGLEPGRWILWAAHETHLPAQEVEVELEDRDVPVTFDLRAPASLLGRVEGAAGREDLQVDVVRIQPSMRRILGRAPVGPDGRFSYERLEPGEYGLVLTDPQQLLPTFEERVTILPGVPDQAVVIDARASGSLLCEVVDGEGVPVEDVGVVLYTRSTRLGPGGRTGPGGTLRLTGILAGPVHVRLTPDHRTDPRDPRLERTVEVRPGEESRVRLTAGEPPDEPTGVLRGRVRGVPEGARPERLMVWAYRGGPEGVEPVGSDQVSEQGEFELENLPPGRYDLVARGWRSRMRLRPPGAETELGEGRLDGIELGDGGRVTDLEVVLAPTVRVRGRLLVPEGEPAGGARILLRRAGSDGTRVHDPRSSSASGDTESTGRFELSGLLPGPYLLSAHSSEGALGPVPVELPEPSGSAVDLGDHTLSPGARLMVRFDPWVPRHRTRVELLDARGDDLAPDVPMVAGAGETEFFGVPTGPLRVRVTIQEGELLDVRLDARPGETHEVHVQPLEGGPAAAEASDGDD